MLLKRGGYSLIELVVVFLIISILAGLVLSAAQKVRAAAGRIVCANNFRQLSVGTLTYHDANQRLPSGRIGPYVPKSGQVYYGWGPDSHGWSWLAHLLPYLEQTNVHANGQITRQTLRESGVASISIPAFACPAVGSAYAKRTDAGNLLGFEVATTCYKGVSGANWGYDGWENKPVDTRWKNPSARGSYDGLNNPDGAMFRSDILRPLRILNISDGASQTLLMGEDVPDLNRWAAWAYSNTAYGTCAIPPNAKQPNGRPFDPDHWGNTWGFRSRHSGGLQFAFADGSVRFLRDNVSLATYRALATIQGGEVIAPHE